MVFFVLARMVKKTANRISNWILGLSDRRVVENEKRNISCFRDNGYDLGGVLQDEMGRL